MSKLNIFLWKLISKKRHKSHNLNLSRKDANRIVSYIASNNIKEIILRCACGITQNTLKISLLKIYSRYTSRGRYCNVIIEGYLGSKSFVDVINIWGAWVSVKGSTHNLAAILQIQAEPKQSPRKFYKTFLES